MTSEPELFPPAHQPGEGALAPDDATAKVAALLARHMEPPAPEFDWEREDCVVIERQPPVAVYRNNRNHVVLRSQGYDDDSDPFFTVAGPDDLQRLITALQRELRAMREEHRK